MRRSQRREIKKSITKEKIINSSKELFFKKGYERTTIAEIAEKSDIATGTIYNYFNSKGEILLEILKSEVKEKFANDKVSWFIREAPLKDRILLTLKDYFDILSSYSKSLWSELLALSLKKNSIKEKLQEMDVEVLSIINSMISEEKSKIKEHFELSSIGLSIIFMFIFYFMLWSSDKNFKKETLFSSMSQFIDMLFYGVLKEDLNEES